METPRRERAARHVDKPGKNRPGHGDGSPRYSLAVWLASGGGIGLVAPAPGTFGSLWGLLLAWAMTPMPTLAAALLIMAVCAVGVPLCTAAARELGAKDPGPVVWDEIAAVPITFFLIDLNQEPLTVAILLAAGFVLFRFFDILKPPPARWLERLPRGLGIMADDWAAGLYACVCLHAVAALLASGR